MQGITYFFAYHISYTVSEKHSNGNVDKREYWLEDSEDEPSYPTENWD